MVCGEIEGPSLKAKAHSSMGFWRPLSSTESPEREKLVSICLKISLQTKSETPSS